MIKQRIRRWMWITSGVCAVISFLLAGTILRSSLDSAILGAILCGLIPLVVGAWLLFSPSDSHNSPLRYMGHQWPSITHTDEPDKSKVIPRPKKKKRR
jgi:hypothetical protein